MKAKLEEAITILQNGLPNATGTDMDKLREFCAQSRKTIYAGDAVFGQVYSVARQKGFRDEELQKHIIPAIASLELLKEKAHESIARIVTFLTYWYETVTNMDSQIAKAS